LVRKSGKVRDEERERVRGESSRLLVSEANVLNAIFVVCLYSEHTRYGISQCLRRDTGEKNDPGSQQNILQSSIIFWAAVLKGSNSF